MDDDSKMPDINIARKGFVWLTVLEVISVSGQSTHCCQKLGRVLVGKEKTAEGKCRQQRKTKKNQGNIL